MPCPETGAAAPPNQPTPTTLPSGLGRAAILTALSQPGATSAAVAVAYEDGSSVTYTSGASAALYVATAKLAEEVAQAAPPRGWGQRGQTPAWVWTDIDGQGPRWHLALQDAAGKEPDTLTFPFAEFAEEAQEFGDCPTVIIRPPPPLPPEPADGEHA